MDFHLLEDPQCINFSQDEVDGPDLDCSVLSINYVYYKKSGSPDFPLLEGIEIDIFIGYGHRENKNSVDINQEIKNTPQYQNLPVWFLFSEGAYITE